MKATPPEEKRRRQRALEKAEAEEVYLLDLKPFCQVPNMEFNNVKLGDVAVRKLLVRNTSAKVMQVHICVSIKLLFSPLPQYISCAVVPCTL